MIQGIKRGQAIGMKMNVVTTSSGLPMAVVLIATKVAATKQAEADIRQLLLMNGSELVGLIRLLILRA